jgi:uncharacterized cupredoxin-like copper-binding protein
VPNPPVPPHAGLPRARRPIEPRGLALAVALGAAALLGACNATAAPTAPISPGTAAAPREVNVIAKEWTFVPPVVDLVPGETVLLHVVNGGTEVHEAVIGGPAVQDAWEAAEAAVAGGPPGPTPAVSVPPAVTGIRVVVRSGERVDLTWTVPADGPAIAGGFVVGCHIPGHYARGMVVPVRWLGPDGLPLESLAASEPPAGASR